MELDDEMKAMRLQEEEERLADEMKRNEEYDMKAVLSV